LLANRLQSDWRALSLEAVASSAAVSAAGGATAAAEGLTVGQQLLLQLRDTKPVGRLVVDVEGVIKGPSGGPDDVLLKDGDKLIIPKKNARDHDLGRSREPKPRTSIRQDSHAMTILPRAAVPRRRRTKSASTSCVPMATSLRRPVGLVQAQPIRGNAAGRYDRGAARYGTGESAPALQAVTTIIYNLSHRISVGSPIFMTLTPHGIERTDATPSDATLKSLAEILSRDRKLISSSASCSCSSQRSAHSFRRRNIRERCSLPW